MADSAFAHADEAATLPMSHRPRRMLMGADPISALVALAAAYGVLRLRGVGLSETAVSTLLMCAVIILIPVELVVISAIILESGLPVFYKSPRVGKNGHLFGMYKFRTMVKDVDARFQEVEAANELNGCDGLMFKMKRDPRVTRVGTILRKYSLDELPQFLNVLGRDMSVVGPRPPLPREVEKYEREHLYRLRAVPGITGMWQTSGRSDLDFEDMVRLDRYYLDNWSIRLDLQIIIKTVLVVLGRKGAY